MTIHDKLELINCSIQENKNFEIEVTKNYLLINKTVKIYLPKDLQELFLTEYIENTDSALKQILNLFRFDIPNSTIVCLPDTHSGYLLPIGTVLAFKVSKDCPVYISPFGIGYDIGCGVRTISTTLYKQDFSDIDVNLFADELRDKIFKSSEISLHQLASIINTGLSGLKSSVHVSAVYANDNLRQDIKCTNLFENIKDVFEFFPRSLLVNGLTNFGTLGKGNHYLELQYVEEIFDEEAAKFYNLTLNQVLISIHSGSRAFGYKICQIFSEDNDALLDIESPVGSKYYRMMNAANNYAICNREIISDKTISLFCKTFDSANIDFQLLTDTSHNIATYENIDNSKYFVHRKGASGFDKHGLHPLVAVGGSMATCSYLVKPGYKTKEFFFSTCHGSGRKLSRSCAKKKLSLDNVIKNLDDQKIIARSKKASNLIDESAECYKDIESVIEHSEIIGSCKKVARVKPFLVIKE